MKKVSNARYSPNQLCLQLLLLTLFFAGCSLNGGEEPNALVKQTLTSVASNYLIALVGNDVHYLRSAVDWPEYQSKNSVSHNEVTQITSNWQDRWSLEDDPLNNLKVKKILQDENSAMVRLHNPIKEDAPEVLINLYWSSSGWKITSDNIFGPSGIVENRI